MAYLFLLHQSLKDNINFTSEYLTCNERKPNVWNKKKKLNLEEK